MVSDALFDLADSTAGRKPTARVPYASAAWQCQPLPDRDEARVSIAWSVPLDDRKYQSGVTTFLTKFPKSVERSEAFRPFVEESLGIIYHKPSPAEQEWNAHLERLVADYLLFFVHRVFFGQCEKMWPALVTFKGKLDNMLILGPTLPKFRGRICYSHFSRSKTLAVISADARHGLPPAMGDGQWIGEPSPPYWHDYSARTWRLNDEPKDRSSKRCKSVEIVVPTGDGFGGRLDAGGTVGTSLWREKFEKVKNIVDDEREPVRLSMWSNQEVFLPHGLAQTARVLALADAVRIAETRRAQILKSATPEEKELYATAQKRAPQADRSMEQPDIRSLVFCRSIETHLKRRAAKPAAQVGSKARRDQSASAGLVESVESTISDLKEEFGNDLMSYSIHSIHEKA
jgi:hypothetical protein